MFIILLIIITSWLLNIILPWWSIAIPGLVFGFQYPEKSLKAFGVGFIALFILWGSQAAAIHIANEGILSNRIAEMLQIYSGWLLVIATGLIGGLVSGLAYLTGSLLKGKKE